RRAGRGTDVGERRALAGPGDFQVAARDTGVRQPEVGVLATADHVASMLEAVRTVRAVLQLQDGGQLAVRLHRGRRVPALVVTTTLVVAGLPVAALVVTTTLVVAGLPVAALVVTTTLVVAGLPVAALVVPGLPVAALVVPGLAVPALVVAG